MGILSSLFPKHSKEAQSKESSIKKGMTNQFGQQEDWGAQTWIKGRGYNVYTSADLLRISAEGKDRTTHIVPVEQKYTTIDPLTCVMIYQKCPPVFSVVSSRANRISSLNFHVTPETKIEDRIAFELKNWRSIFVEADRPSPINAGRRYRAYSEIRKVLPEIYIDLSNFDSAIKRWSKRIKNDRLDRCSEIEDFFGHPAPGILWPTFIKQCVQDLLIQGRLAIYKKEVSEAEGSRIGNLFVLPGGSVVPIKGTYVGQLHGYVQLTDGMTQPQLFFQDEIAFAEYMPLSSTSWGINPIDSLINLIATNLLFSERMSNMADGSKPPEKAVVFGEKNPGLDATDPNTMQWLDDPITKDEQRRIENALNRVKRERAILTLTGVGQPMVLDLSKADTIPTELQYQEKIDRYVAMVYNASNQEINQTGGDGTSGRSTSESQERSDNAKGERPIIRILEEMFTRDIIAYRYGFGYRAEWSATRSDEEEVDLAMKKVNSGIWAPNEIRDEMNYDPFPESEFDRPKAAQAGQKSEDALGSIADSLRR